MKKLLLLVAVLVTLFTSCIKNLDSNVDPEALKAITLKKDTLNILQGDSTVMKYSLTPSNYDQSLTWHISDTSVISVAHGGKVCAKNIGMSLVTISNREKTVSGTCLVLVSNNLATASLAKH